MFNFKNVDPEELTLDYIYSRVSKEDIYKFCLNADLEFHKAILSPLRKDNSPSFTLKRTPDGEILWRDWGTGKHGFSVQLVQEMYNCTFGEALKIIYVNLIKGHISNSLDVKLELTTQSKERAIEEKKQTLIEVKKKPFTVIDFNYWNSYGISLSTLLEYNVMAVENVWLNKYDYQSNKYNGWRMLKQYTKEKPLYAYKFTRYKYISYKIYSPFDTTYKWFSNVDEDDIQGFDQLPLFGDYVVLTKSLKDVMCLYEMGIPAIALQGEHAKLKSNFYNKLKERFPEILLFYDNDEPGKKGSNKVAKEYNLKEMFIPKWYKTKDISDTIKRHGFETSSRLMKRLIKNARKNK